MDMSNPWTYLIILSILAVVGGIVGTFFYFFRKGIESRGVDLKPVLAAIGTCNENILTVSTLSSKTSGTLEQVVIQIGDIKESFIGFKKEFLIHKEHCKGRFDLLEGRQPTKEEPIKKN